MVGVIIAGGSGTRLWPLSTPAYPKHLLQVNGDANSLLQNTFERIRQIADAVYIVSEAGHAHHVRQQLPEVPEANFIIEPARRGTASCILAALARITREHPDNEAIAFSHADHYIRDVHGFARSICAAANVALREGRIVLVGVEPDRPATGFGYIKKGRALPGKAYVHEVHSFKEKPDYATAKEYLKSGNYLWNCGYFVGSIRTFVRAMKEYAPDMLVSFEKLAQAADEDYKTTYLELENVAIDYALIEKVPDLLVVPAAFDWMDLGTYADMYKAVEKDEQGNHVHGNVETESVENSFIQNHEGKPLAVIGLDNIVVVNTPHGILVARKDASQKVGEVSKRLKPAA